LSPDDENAIGYTIDKLNYRQPMLGSRVH